MEPMNFEEFIGWRYAGKAQDKNYLLFKDGKIISLKQENLFITKDYKFFDYYKKGNCLWVDARGVVRKFKQLDKDKAALL